MSSAIKTNDPSLKNAGIPTEGSPSIETGTLAVHTPYSQNTAYIGTDLTEGVSVESTPKKGYEWFVLRATYGREILACNIIRKNGGSAYVALHRTIKEINGHRRKVVEPLVHQFVFVYATPAQAETLVKDTPELAFLTYYYNHFAIGSNGYNPPLTVPFHQMENFIRVTSVDDEHVQSINPDLIKYKTGDMVRVNSGKFEGVVGRVARINRQNRVVVELSGICLIATAYIPSYALQPV